MNDKNKYFPLFLDMSRMKIVIVGGGAIATRRALTLCRFDTNLEIVAPKLTTRLQQLIETENIAYKKMTYTESVLADKDLVLACTNDLEVNHRIFEDCKKRNLLVNNCSDKEECDFYFPAVVEADDIVIGINGGGKDHRRVKQVRERIEESVNFPEFSTPERRM